MTPVARDGQSKARHQDGRASLIAPNRWSCGDTVGRRPGRGRTGDWHTPYTANPCWWQCWWDPLSAGPVPSE